MAKTPKKTAAVSAAPLEDTDVVVSVRMRRSLRRRLNVYAAQHERQIQDIAAEAIEDFLKKRGA